MDCSPSMSQTNDWLATTRLLPYSRFPMVTKVGSIVSIAIDPGIAVCSAHYERNFGMLTESWPWISGCGFWLGSSSSNRRSDPVGGCLSVYGDHLG